MGSYIRLRVFGAAIIAAVSMGVGSVAQAMPVRASLPAAKFAPRLGPAWGLVPALGRASGLTFANQPLVFHGGPVMHGIHVHTVFWAPAGYAFPPSPGAEAPSYTGLLQRFFSDAASSSGSASTVFSVLDEYGDAGGRGTAAITYAPGSDAVTDTDPYPASPQCQSPAGLAACLTSGQIEHEIDRVVSRQDSSGRGLHDLWLLLTPPNVDVCVMAPMCGTTAFAGYHSEFDLGHGPTLYALVVNPLIEGVPPHGIDPEGNPVAEVAADVAAHETVEAGTDPQGTGWFDPSGGEIGDKCQGSNGGMLGYAPDGAPYNQMLGGDPFLVQTMWSNAGAACVTHAGSAPAPALPTVAMTQFSARVRGNIAIARAGIAVHLRLLRAGTPVAAGSAQTGPHGDWVATLRALRTGASAVVGDDRDELDVSYGRGGPAAESIATGEGAGTGTASYTGWSLLDSGFALRGGKVTISPCTQVGLLRVTIAGRPTPDPVPACQVGANISVVPTGPVGPGTRATLSSTDNRAPGPADPAGALVRLTIAMGEPGSSSGPTFFPSALAPTGFPTCTADLARQTVSCTGLVSGAPYRLRRGLVSLDARAGRDGQARFAAPAHAAWFAGGDALGLRNRVGRLLSTLHVAHLRVALTDTGRVTGGVCQPGEYWGISTPPPPPPSLLVPSLFFFESGPGSAPQVCPLSGRVRGLAAGPPMQTDSFSGGTTTTEVPQFALVSPANAATLSGPFLALARLAGPARGASVSVQITRAGFKRPAVRRYDITRGQGARVARLAPGLYRAVWTVTDRNGDTRALRTYFVQEP